MKKRKLAPWEIERKKKRDEIDRLLAIQKKKRQADYQRKYRAGKIKVDDRMSWGRALAKKTKNGISLQDQASFSCPRCENNIKENLIRLRQDLYECRKCKHTFIKENIIDEFDFDCEP